MYHLPKLGSHFTPPKGILKAFGDKISEYNIYADALLEKASAWISYRISSIHWSHGSVNEKLKHVQVSVTTDSITNAITFAAGDNPVSISP